MADLLLELYCEEIPARMQAPAAENLKKLITDAIIEAGLNYAAAIYYWTPRRICLDLRGLSEHSAPKLIEKKGPSITAPELAIQGFLRSTGLKDISEAKIISIPSKGDFYFAFYEQPRRSALSILEQILPNVIKQFTWPKAMRWGAASAHSNALRWVRPLQNILCILYNEFDNCQIVPFEVDGIRATDYSFGHRFMANNEVIKVKSFAEYQTKLEQSYVILDAQRRQNIIRSDAENLCFANQLQLVADADLLAEVANLVEFPVVLLGRFDEKFMAIPQKIIQTTIRENQKCFVTSKLTEPTVLSNYFVICANITTADGGELIIKGNEKVVQARLSDAEYFFNKDLEDSLSASKLKDLTSCGPLNLDLSKPLDQRMGLIVAQERVFYKNLGTQGQRAVRLLELSSFVAPMFDIADLSLVQRTASLAKADLATHMVPEFPSLQGYVGREYALAQGEKTELALAIEEHYKPQGPGDNLPKSPLSVVLALADKIDVLVGFWLINEKPTGSRDPFALRRAALGVVRLILSRKENIPLAPILEYSRSIFLAQLKLKKSDIIADLLAFIYERFRIYVQSEGARQDAIEAVMASKDDRLLVMARKIEALIAFLDKDTGKNFYIAVKRVSNILANFDLHDAELDNKLLQAEPEKVLFDAVLAMQKKLAIALAKEDFIASFDSLTLLTAPIERFFDELLVEDKVEAIKLNRLSLLRLVLQSSKQLADFSKIIA